MRFWSCQSPEMKQAPSPAKNLFSPSPFVSAPASSLVSLREKSSAYFW